MKLLARKEDVSVILLDETEAGLDKSSQQIMDDIEKELLANKEKYIIVKISHGSLNNIEAYDRIIDMNS